MMSVETLILLLAVVDDVVSREFEEARRRIYYELVRRLTLINELYNDAALAKSSKRENTPRIYYVPRRNHPDEDDLKRHL